MLKHFMLSCLLGMTLTGCATFRPNTASHDLSDTFNEQAYIAKIDHAYTQLADSNGYPTPQQVLALAEELQLTEQQVQQSRGIYAEMQKFADELIEQLAHKLSIMQYQYTTGVINDDTLALLLSEIGILETKLHYVRMSAYLKQQAVLSAEQITRYHHLRYTSQQQQKNSQE